MKIRDVVFKYYDLGWNLETEVRVKKRFGTGWFEMMTLGMFNNLFEIDDTLYSDCEVMNYWEPSGRRDYIEIMVR